jgi:hypothetical protein
MSGSSHGLAHWIRHIDVRPALILYRELCEHDIGPGVDLLQGKQTLSIDKNFASHYGGVMDSDMWNLGTISRQQICQDPALAL